MTRTVEISEKYTLEVPVEFAYEFLTDLRNDGKWYSAVRNVQVVPAQDPSDASVTAYSQNLTMLGLSYTARIEVRRVEPPHRAELRTVDSGIPFVCTYLFREITPTVTEFTIVAQASAGGPFRLLPTALFRRLLVRRSRSHFARLPDAIKAEQQAVA